MSGPNQPPSLEDLGARLKKARGESVQSSPPASMSGYAQGLRLSLEMVAAVVVGGGIGWFVDGWLETMPLFLLIFLALGLIAGIWNVYQAASQLNSKYAMEEDPAKRDEEDGG